MVSQNVLRVQSGAGSKGEESHQGEKVGSCRQRSYLLNFSLVLSFQGSSVLSAGGADILMRLWRCLLKCGRSWRHPNVGVAARVVFSRDMNEVRDLGLPPADQPMTSCFGQG